MTSASGERTWVTNSRSRSGTATEPLIRKPENNMDRGYSPLQTVVTSEQTMPIRSSHTAGEATADDSPILHAAIGLAEQIRAARDEIERDRRIPPGIAQAMKDAGVFGMAMPR